MKRAIPRTLCLLTCFLSFAGIASAEDLWQNTPAPHPGDPIDYFAWFHGVENQRSKRGASPYYMEAAQQLSNIENPPLLNRAIAGPWADRPGDIDAWLAENRSALEGFRKASRMQTCRMGLRTTPRTTDISELRLMLRYCVVQRLFAFDLATKGLLADGWRSWDQSDRPVLFDRVAACLRIARHLDPEAPIAARMTGLAIRERSYRTLYNALTNAADPATFLDDFSKYRPMLAHKPNELTRAYALERASAWDVLQHIFASRSDGTMSRNAMAIYEDIRKTSRIPLTPWAEAQSSLSEAGFSRTKADIDGGFERLVAWNALPTHKAVAASADLEHYFEELQNPLARGLLKDLTIPRMYRTRIETLRRGLVCLVRIMEFRKATGSWPRSLSEAAGRDEDTIDPYSGKPFIFARTRESILLYSVGSDQKDDAGRSYLPGSEAGDLVIWPWR